mgnify:CR=1 FL=1
MNPLRTINNYTRDLVTLSKSALVETTTTLLMYSGKIILGGGWAPFFILEKYGVSSNIHCGSIDIDLLLDPEIVKEPYISDISQLLYLNNFEKLTEDPFPFRFAPPLKTGLEIYNEYPIHVEFITDLSASPRENTASPPKIVVPKIKGVRFAFNHSFTHIITAYVKEHLVTAQLKVLDPIGSIVLKAFALESRYKEKDAYDIYMLVRYLKDPLSIREGLSKSKNDPIVQDAVSILRRKFSSRDADGPAFIAEFLATLTLEEKEQVKTDAYMRVNQILEGL